MTTHVHKYVCVCVCARTHSNPVQPLVMWLPAESDVTDFKWEQKNQGRGVRQPKRTGDRC